MHVVPALHLRAPEPRTDAALASVREEIVEEFPDVIQRFVLTGHHVEDSVAAVVRSVAAPHSAGHPAARVDGTYILEGAAQGFRPCLPKFIGW